MQVIVDGLLTVYTRTGNQAGALPVLLVLHGWGDNTRNWADFSRRFSDTHTVVAVDLPGFGGTEMPTQPWGLDEYAQFVAHFLRKIGVRPQAVVGHSNGGAIAIRGLARSMFETDVLILLASAGVRSEYKGRKKALRMVAKTGKLLSQPLPKSVKDKLRSTLYATVGSDMLVAEHLQETFKRVVNDDVQDDAALLTQPTLLVYGQDDVSTPPNFGRLLHERIAGSTLELVGEAGHFVYQDQPDTVERLIRNFLKNLKDTAA